MDKFVEGMQTCNVIEAIKDYVKDRREDKGLSDDKVYDLLMCIIRSTLHVDCNMEFYLIYPEFRPTVQQVNTLVSEPNDTKG